ncbi:response regulator [Anabaena cylindrica FACHB-243]|uniref:histidine kinase n=1 Tax=Anabaena cylindrica (strain ATCC 27899 / PCC 7122) TaxID=272123 RepID=K9ZBU2_ANACC|nr:MULTISPECIES: response regulator [Anabaena]AFZ55840.1 response regulator receiver protein [Anabaena cylindrica PCC 7122]MBD2421261.1 response regulator [Anabaena cylindrica FACHB-243]MBY5284124.1 response regulator [Anabaena sp. CCAP 1446/1C]MBY5308092.1 response regulator [Anabaena sp. CCAP 1446/1C]MCM2406592.1 response regulator [Anabaena sp. CCAP 1446/1C]
MSLILVIEDETQILLNLQEILELGDFSVITASNGIIGLQLAKSKNPDLIICDIMMPGLNGYEVLQELRRDPRSADIPLIFLTAKIERDDVRQGMGLGADDYITKPFEPFEILQAITARLERHSIYNQAYLQESQKTEIMQQEIKKNRIELQNSQELSEIRRTLLERISQDLCDPLSSINMAIHMLKHAKEEKDRDRYLSILKEAYTQEITILNEVDSLQELLTADNTKLLRNYKLLK